MEKKDLHALVVQRRNGDFAVSARMEISSRDVVPHEEIDGMSKEEITDVVNRTRDEAVDRLWQKYYLGHAWEKPREVIEAITPLRKQRTTIIARAVRKCSRHSTTHRQNQRPPGFRSRSCEASSCGSS